MLHYFSAVTLFFPFCLDKVAKAALELLAILLPQPPLSAGIIGMSHYAWLSYSFKTKRDVIYRDVPLKPATFPLYTC